MARIRTVKPEFWTDGRMVSLSPWARLFYIGTWNFALCDRGHLPDDPMGLKLKILPADPVDPSELIDELLGQGRLLRKVTADGRTYLHILRLPDHQKTDPRWQTRCPFCLAEAQEATDENVRPPQTTQANTETQPASPKLSETPASHGEAHPSSPMDRKGKDSKGSTSKTSSPASPPRAHDPGDPPDPDAIPGLPPIPHSARDPAPGSDDDPDWVKFWTVYPNSAGKADARKAWAAAVKKVAPFVIIAAAEKYSALVEKRGTAKQHIKHASGWLNTERWTDEIDLSESPAPPPGFAPGSGQRAYPDPSEFGQGKARI